MNAIMTFKKSFFSLKVMLSFGAAPASSCGKGNSSALPDYLPEDEDDVVVSDKVSRRCRKLAVLVIITFNIVSSDFSFQAIAKVGGENKENGGWFSSVSSLLSKTLYW